MDARPVCEKCSTVGHGYRVADPPGHGRSAVAIRKISGMISIFVSGALSQV